MKNLFLAILCLIFINLANAQFVCSCLPEGITFETQAQIDSFQINYPGCTEIEGDVIINGNDISNLNGLSVLTSIGEDLVIGSTSDHGYINPLLISLEGLSNLEDIGGGLSIGNNYVLPSLMGLNNITSLDYLRIYGNEFLEDISDLENLTRVDGVLAIGTVDPSWGFPIGNPLLQSLAGLENLISVDVIVIVGNESLTSIAALGNLTGTIDYGVLISDNPVLMDLTGLEGLTSIEDNLYVGHNYSLNSLSGLINIDSIGGNFRLAACDINSLEGLNSLITVGGDLYIGNNVSLTSFSGLENLTSIGGDFHILENGVNGLEGLNSLQSAGGCLNIGSNDDLSSLNGLNNLTYIGGDLSIVTNNNLTSLNGLNYLNSIGGYIAIAGNQSIVSLEGIENLNAGSIEGLYVYENPNLSTCHVLSVCDYLAIPGASVNISNNAPGCNSQEEVEEACMQTSIEDQSSTFIISISPNPVKNNAILRIDLSTKNPLEICIYNTTGICLQHWLYPNQQPGQKEFQLDMKDIPAGIYFCRIQVCDEGVTKKIIKL